MHTLDAGPALLGRCLLCEGHVRDDDAVEMHDPILGEPRGELVHPECGLAAGWEMKGH